MPLYRFEQEQFRLERAGNPHAHAAVDQAVAIGLILPSRLRLHGTVAPERNFSCEELNLGELVVCTSLSRRVLQLASAIAVRISSICERPAKSCLDANTGAFRSIAA